MAYPNKIIIRSISNKINYRSTKVDFFCVENTLNNVYVYSNINREIWSLLLVANKFSRWEAENIAISDDKIKFLYDLCHFLQILYITQNNRWIWIVLLQSIHKIKWRIINLNRRIHHRWIKNNNLCKIHNFLTIVTNIKTETCYKVFQKVIINKMFFI